MLDKIKFHLDRISTEYEGAKTFHEAADLWEDYGPSMMKAILVLVEACARIDEGKSGRHNVRKALSKVEKMIGVPEYK